MILSKDDAALFYKLQWNLMFHLNEEKKIIPGLDYPNFKNQPMEKIGKLDGLLFSNPQYIDSFIAENPENLSEDELLIVKGWKNYIKDEFIIARHSKNGSIFLKSDENPKAYLVVGLLSELEEMFPYTPLMASAVLLPFKGKIVYSGIIRPYNISFGGHYRATFKEDFQKAKSTYGIISSLEEPVAQKKDSEEDLLRFYSRTSDNRFKYMQEIGAILKNKPELERIYWIETAKSNSRKLRKNLELQKIGHAWFAVLGNTIVASGKSKEIALQRAKEILPADKTEFIYIFENEEKSNKK